MPRIRTTQTRPPPDGFEEIEPILEEYETKMRDAENDTHEGKRKAESVWPIMRITHMRSRYIYDLFYKREAISRELYEWLVEQKYADAAYVSVLTQLDCKVEAVRLRKAVLCALHPVSGMCSVHTGHELRGIDLHLSRAQGPAAARHVCGVCSLWYVSLTHTGCRGCSSAD